jgi:hypothetical protein
VEPSNPSAGSVGGHAGSGVADTGLMVALAVRRYLVDVPLSMEETRARLIEHVQTVGLRRPVEFDAYARGLAGTVGRRFLYLRRVSDQRHDFAAVLIGRLHSTNGGCRLDGFVSINPLVVAGLLLRLWVVIAIPVYVVSSDQSL